MVYFPLDATPPRQGTHRNRPAVDPQQCIVSSRRQPGFEGFALIEYEILSTKGDKLPVKPYPYQVMWLHGLIVRAAAGTSKLNLHLRLLQQIGFSQQSPNAPSISGFHKTLALRLLSATRVFLRKHFISKTGSHPIVFEMRIYIDRLQENIFFFDSSFSRRTLNINLFI